MTIKPIDTDKCTGCKICVNACPMDVIHFDAEIQKAYVKYVKECVCCFNCEEDCPTHAIYVYPSRYTQIPPAW
ncbi:MAG: ferredoxin family protein [Clostridiales bacterium]